jgi:hypothetical protein
MMRVMYKKIKDEGIAQRDKRLKTQPHIARTYC